MLWIFQELEFPLRAKLLHYVRPLITCFLTIISKTCSWRIFLCLVASSKAICCTKCGHQTPLTMTFAKEFSNLQMNRIWNTAEATGKSSSLYSLALHFSSAVLLFTFRLCSTVAAFSFAQFSFYYPETCNHFVQICEQITIFTRNSHLNVNITFHHFEWNSIGSMNIE